jgi:hypothetical protein
VAKVLVLAEGQTEETFVKRLLAPQLEPMGVHIIPTIIATKRVKGGGHFKGGIPSYSIVKKEIQRLLSDSSAAMVTTMIDYYGLPSGFPGRANVRGGTPLERVRYVETALSDDINNSRFRAYYSLHEFEALLFASPATIAQAFAAPKLEQKLLAIRAAFNTPEDIDDDPATAPSVRLQSLYPRYGKPFFGTLIASRIGLETIRNECSHFRDWLIDLERVAEQSV